MKLIDKDALVAEIERKIEICKKVILNLQFQENKDLFQDKADLYKEVLSFINTLPEESVSENLEEASRNYGDELDNVLSVVVDDDNSIGEYAAQAYKAGAQWDRQQMMSKAIDALVHTFDNGYIRVGTQLLANNKYGLKVGDKVKVIIIKDE